MSRQNKTANQYTVCTLGLSRQRKRIWWMGLWTVAWWSQTRHHCICHHPGTSNSNRWSIGHSFCPTIKGEGDSHKQNIDAAEQFMQNGVFANSIYCSTHFLELINPGQRLPISCSFNSVLVWYNLLLDLPPPLSQLIRSCHLFHLATLSLEVAYLFFLAASTHAERWQGYQ